MPLLKHLNRYKPRLKNACLDTPNEGKSTRYGMAFMIGVCSIGTCSQLSNIVTNNKESFPYNKVLGGIVFVWLVCSKDGHKHAFNQGPQGAKTGPVGRNDVSCHTKWCRNPG